MLAKRDGPSKNDPWLLHRSRNDLVVIDFFGEAPMKKIAARTQASSAAFIEGAAMARS